MKATLPTAVAYVRVSTKRQASHEMSLPTQEKLIRNWCETNGYNLETVYIEAGASALTDRRPEFQRMIADCLVRPKTIDAIICVDFSRFFRDEHEFEAYRRRLANNGVAVFSATQSNGIGAEGNFNRRIINFMDGYNSEINAIQVKRAMTANAEEGFWNGSKPPMGYRIVEVEKRRDKQKKKLEIDPVEAPVVRKIFDLYLEGDGASGPLGVNRIVAWLNERGYTIREKPFRTSTVHQLLKRETYCGTHYYNCRDSRLKVARPRSEWVATEVPAIVSPAEFSSVQARLVSRSPRVTAPRTVSSPTLLAGIAVCGHQQCGSGMILSTGKGGQYRYYACVKKRTQGKQACASPNVSMPLVDEIIVRELEQRILVPERLNKLLEAVLDRSNEAQRSRTAELKLLRTEKARTDAAVQNLLGVIETGQMSVRDPIFAERMAGHRARLEAVGAEVRILERQLSNRNPVVTPKIVARFGDVMRKRLRGNDHQLRQGYVRLLVDTVTIGNDSIQIRGSKAALAHAVVSQNRPDGGVPTFIRNWRTRQDSNL